MRILCFIDSLGPGGAQRQLATLAVGLKKRGHDVRFVVYHAFEHFLPVLQNAGIPLQIVRASTRVGRVVAVRRVLREGWQDVVLAFLEASCLYAEIARIPRQRWGLVVGERSANPAMRQGVAKWMRYGHRLADGIVANSHTIQLMLQRQWPFLKNRLTTVYNALDLEQFQPNVADPTPNLPRSDFRLVVGGSYQENKNMVGVAKALLHLRSAGSTARLVVDWFGGMPANHQAYDRAQSFIAQNGLTGILNLHSATKDLAREFRASSAVGLFSFFEGLPNVICEGMACGKPVVMSNVCDAGNLVRDGVNGFLCDPHDPGSIAAAIEKLAGLTSDELLRMGTESRRLAEELFDQPEIVRRYEGILTAAARGRPVPSDCCWPALIPESAIRTAAAW